MTPSELLLALQLVAAFDCDDTTLFRFVAASSTLYRLDCGRRIQENVLEIEHQITYAEEVTFSIVEQLAAENPAIQWRDVPAIQWADAPSIHWPDVPAIQWADVPAIQ